MKVILISQFIIRNVKADFICVHEKNNEEGYVKDVLFSIMSILNCTALHSLHETSVP